MPLCAPKSVSHIDWVTLKQDDQFVIQQCSVLKPNSGSISKLKRNASASAVSSSDSISKISSNYRILLRCNQLCIGEFNDKVDLQTQWDFLHPASHYIAFDSCNPSITQQIWQDKMVSLQNTMSSQTEQEFVRTVQTQLKSKLCRDQSSIMASYMSIMELGKGLVPNSSNSSFQDIALMITLTISLSRLLLQIALKLVSRYRSSQISQEIILSTPTVPHGDIMAAINLLEHSPLGDTTNKPTSNLVLAANEDNTDILYSSLNPVEALVFHVDKLYDLLTKNSNKLETALRNLERRKINRQTLNSEAMNSQVYFMPYIDSENKSSDKAKLELILSSNLKESTNMFTKLRKFFEEVLTSNSNNISPLTTYLQKIAQNARQFFLDNSSGLLKVLTANLSDDFIVIGNSQLLLKFKEIIDQHSSYFSISMQLTFDPITSEVSIADILKQCISEVILSQVYTSIISHFRKLNDSKDDVFYNQCLALQRGLKGPESLGLNEHFLKILNEPHAMDQFHPLCDRFINENSVRVKFECLEELSSKIYQLASDGLKKIAASAGKPYDPSNPEDRFRFAVGADDFVPLLAYTLIQMAIPDIHAQFSFLTVFSEESSLTGRNGYLLASLQMAIMVISDLQAPSTSSPSSIQTLSVSSNDIKRNDKLTSSSVLIRVGEGSDPLSISSEIDQSLSFDGNSKDSNSNQDDTIEFIVIDPVSPDQSEIEHKIKKDSYRPYFSSENHISTLFSLPINVLNLDEDLQSLENTRLNEPSPLSLVQKLLTKKKHSSISISQNSSNASPPGSGKFSISKESKQNISESSSSPRRSLDPLNSESAYNLSIKLLSCLICLYQRHEHHLFACQPTQTSPSLSAEFHSTTKSEQSSPLGETSQSILKTDDLFKNYMDEVKLLKSIDLSLLVGKQRLVFFLNIYHACYLHSCIEKGMPNTLSDRLYLCTTSAYNIGGVVFTLMEIEHGILKHLAPFPDSFLNSESISVKPSLDHSDNNVPSNLAFPSIWKSSSWDKAKYAVTIDDARITFLISSLAVSGPPLRICTSENIEELLDQATQQYVSKSVLVNRDNSVIVLPKQFIWYAKQFGTKERIVLNWISSYLDSTQRNTLKSLKNIRIKYNEFDWGFLFSFGPS